MQINAIDTTIYIKLDLVYKLTESSSNNGIPINKIIVILINKLLSNCSIKATLFNTVKYQKSGNDIVWHKLHVSFSPDVYEKALDLRKLMKMSVSYLIARAIELYLDQVIKELFRKDNADNYSSEYVFISSKCRGLLYFTIFWRKPRKSMIKKYTVNHSEGCFIRMK